MPIVSIYRKAQFNAAHKLGVAEWTDAENLAFFGPCANPFFHGHNYTLIVKLTGEVDEKTGYLFDLGKLSKIIEDEIIERFDHKNLNLDTVEFKDKNPTAEHIAVVIWQILRPMIPERLELSVKLFETEKNHVKYKGL